MAADSTWGRSIGFKASACPRELESARIWGAVRLRGRDVSERRLALGGKGRVWTAPRPTGSSHSLRRSCTPHCCGASSGGLSRTSEEWRGEALPSWVRRVGPSQFPLPTALGGGDPLEFRFRLLWPRAGGESGAGVQFVLWLCASPSACLGLAAARGCCTAPDSPPGDGAA